MPQREKITVEKRTIVGKKVSSLRKQGLMTLNIYGKSIKSISVQTPLKAFKELYKKVHETGLVDVELDKTMYPSLIHNLQINPRSQEIIHADFYKVDLKEKIKANIPVVSVGAAPAEVDKKGLLLHLISEVEVEALPTDLPEKIEVNIESLKELNDEIPVSAIKAPTGVTILTDQAQIVFKIGELVSKETEEQAKEEEAAVAEAKAEDAAGATPTAATDVKPQEAKTEGQPTKPAA